MNILEENFVNVDEALSIWGDMESYQDGLKEYEESLPLKLEELKNRKENKDWENYTILVHSMKSEAKYLGFLKEAEIFSLHELRGKMRDEKYICENFPLLEDTVSNLILVIQQYFKEL